MAVGATFGLLITRDDGAHWYWVCEDALGLEGTFDPDYELTAGGAFLANTFTGVRISHDGCAWSPVPAPVGTTFVSTMAVGPDDAIYAAMAEPPETRIFKSTDGGATFAPTGELGEPGDRWGSIEVAPGDARRVYVTGFRAEGDNPHQLLLFRSDDGGASWVELPTAAFVGTDSSTLSIAAISPVDADRLFLRVTQTDGTNGEALYLTEDGGTAAPPGPTWTDVLDTFAPIDGVAIRHDGTVWAATDLGDLQRSTDGGHTFAPVKGVAYEGKCLVERADGLLFLCANDLPPDSRALASSATGEAGTWIPRLRFADITAPATCSAGGAERDLCTSLWCGLVDQLGIHSDVITCKPGTGDAGIDAGTTAPAGGGCCDSGGAPPLGEVVLLVALALHAPRRVKRPPPR